MIDPDVVPVLPRGVRLACDDLRNTPVLLGPERVLMIDPIGDAILSRLDGVASMGEICASLASHFDTGLDVIIPDVDSYLQELADKRLVELRHG